jgi:DNA-binding CsgD family transcriptional regulator
MTISPPTPPVRPPSSIPTHILGALESLRCGAFLLDLGGRVLSFNLPALGCLGNGLKLGGGGRLSAVDRVTDQKLQHVVQAALAGPDSGSSQTTVMVQRPARLPLATRIIRLAQDAPRSSSFLLLLILDAELWPDPSFEMLSQAFGLTQAETIVAIGITSGRSLAKIAADRGIKIGTVRAHLKTVFSKTHTRGQADLTRVLTRLSFLVSHTERKIAETHSFNQPFVPPAAEGDDDGGEADRLRIAG